MGTPSEGMVTREGTARGICMHRMVVRHTGEVDEIGPRSTPFVSWLHCA